jgi:hypothetical protein
VSENALVDRETVWQIARLALISLYSIVLLAVDALFFERILTWWVALLFGVLWLAVAATFFAGLSRAKGRKSYLSRHAGYPLLLMAPLLIVPYWTPVLALVLLAAYILELRQLTAGKGFAFSAVLVAFVSIAATWALVYAESKDPRSDLDNWWSAATWTFSSLLRMHTLSEPVTEDGEFVGFVLAVCAVIAASLFTAQLVAWIIGSEKEALEEEERQEREQLQVTVDNLAQEVVVLRGLVRELNDRLGRA